MVGLVRLAVGLGLAIAGLGAASVVQANRGALQPSDASLPGLYARLSRELESHLRTRGETEAETRITLGPGGRDVRLAGELTEGAAGRLGDLLARNPRVERIHLTSDGGLVEEGEGIGALIAARGLVTYVPDYCVSACTLAFVRGRERLILAQSRLGFHGPYETGLFGQDFRVDASAERASYIAAGVDAAFVDGALKVAPDDLWIPEAGRLLQANVATGIVDLSRFPDSTLDDGADLADAREAVLRNFALLRGLEGGAPRILDGIADWYREAYREGLSENEAFEGINRISARAIARLMQDADDATTLANGRMLLKAMERTRVASPDICAAIAAEGDLVLAYEVLARKDGLVLRALLARATNGRPIAISFEQDVLADHARPRTSSSAADCTDLHRRYTQALALPTPAAAAALRTLTAPPAPSRTLEASVRPCRDNGTTQGLRALRRRGPRAT